MGTEKCCQALNQTQPVPKAGVPKVGGAPHLRGADGISGNHLTVITCFLKTLTSLLPALLPLYKAEVLNMGGEPYRGDAVPFQQVAWNE